MRLEASGFHTCKRITDQVHTRLLISLSCHRTSSSYSLRAHVGISCQLLLYSFAMDYWHLKIPFPSGIWWVHPDIMFTKNIQSIGPLVRRYGQPNPSNSTHLVFYPNLLPVLLVLLILPYTLVLSVIQIMSLPPTHTNHSNASTRNLGPPSTHNNHSNAYTRSNLISVDTHNTPCSLPFIASQLILSVEWVEWLVGSQNWVVKSGLGWPWMLVR